MALATTVAGGAVDITPSTSLIRSKPVAEANAGYLRLPVLLSTVPSVLARHQAEATAIAAPSETAAAAAETPALAQTTPSATAAAQPPYFTYTIQPGDTVDSIANAYGIDPNYIIWNNPLVSSDPDVLLVGATLVVPSTDGLVYNVTLGDNLNAIADAYGIDVNSIINYAPNGISSPDTVVEGLVLMLPGAIGYTPEPAQAPSYEEPIPAAAEPEPVYQPAASVGYIWPYYSSLSTYFSGYHPGIDLDGFGNYGAAIVAAASGTVVLAAYDDYGYGYHVIISHDDGSQTLYAHLSDIWVGQGQYVGQGEAIGALGSTGYSTGAHLMFNLYIGGVPVDPLAYLP
jgi:murein DD-endopeptidase MepM/ murein hydrolase activator NlpD